MNQTAACTACKASSILGSGKESLIEIAFSFGSRRKVGFRQTFCGLLQPEMHMDSWMAIIPCFSQDSRHFLPLVVTGQESVDEASIQAYP